jgi:hypothetical protein
MLLLSCPKKTNPIQTQTKPISESYPYAGDEEIILWKSGPRPAARDSDKSGESMQKVVD